MTPTCFVSYSHDDEHHLNWVLQLTTRLRSNGVDMILDKWNLRLGQDVAGFMEKDFQNPAVFFVFARKTMFAKQITKKVELGMRRK